MFESAIAKWFFDLFTSPKAMLIALVLVIVGCFLLYPKIEQIGTFLGFETKDSLKKQVDTLKKDNAVISDVNAGNHEAAVIANNTVAITNNVIDKNIETKSKNSKKVTTIIEDTKQKVDVIEKQPVSDEQKVTEVSTVRIASLIQTYCEFNEDPICTPVVAPEGTPEPIVEPVSEPVAEPTVAPDSQS